MVHRNKPDEHLFSDLNVYYHEKHRGSLRDLSHTGLALESESPLLIGKDYAFLLHNPRTSILLDGKVVRCELELVEPDETKYLIGVHFRFPRDPQEMRLLDLMRKGSSPEEKRSGGPRVKLNLGMAIDIGRPGIDRVTNLTAQGLEMYCERPPEPEDEWDLMLKIVDDAFVIDCHPLQTSRRIDEDGFRIKVEFRRLAQEPFHRIKNYLKSKDLLD
jgi:hypothetical protein